ncbi:amino acid/polyamine transporter I [Amylocarpus encephaloides]|uniref:Amino acid/polyamine transporter I n=1 Tax=Amylocarpus encephaloides TaxID=45428 RepID=A0A9P8C3E3_9HELO|nr:amino acid/polyamine transporter I [Amylocarpus encephaloides]
MPRSFRMVSALGLGFSITNSWVGYLSCFGQNLAYGGPQSVILGLLVALFAQGTVTLGVSELASAFPSSGGQYHFVWILAPEKTKRFAAFMVGWFSIVGWWIVTSSGVSLASVSVFGMVGFWDEAFVGERWMIYLVYLVVVFVTVLPLYFTPKLIPEITTLSLWLSLLGCLVNFTVLLAMKKHTNPSSYIVQSNLGTSGWGQGVAWVLGIMNSMYAFGGTDGAIHIAEETPRPGVKIPMIMNLCIILGALTTFPLFTVMMYGMTDMEAVIGSGLPSAQLIYQVTGSKNVTTFLICWIILVYISCLCSQWVTCGRMAWAFARDGGLPYKNFFLHIDEKRDFPFRTTVAAVVFISIYGLLYLASTTAFNSIVTSAVLFLNITYAVPQAIVAVQGRKSLPVRPLDLGNFGYFVNIFAPCWVTLLGIMICFPPALPVVVESMNYSSLILVGIFGVFLFLWYTIGGNFEGPKIDMVALSEVNALEKRN